MAKHNAGAPVPASPGGGAPRRPTAGTTASPSAAGAAPFGRTASPSDLAAWYGARGLTAPPVEIHASNIAAAMAARMPIAPEVEAERARREADAQERRRQRAAALEATRIDGRTASRGVILGRRAALGLDMDGIHTFAPPVIDPPPDPPPPEKRKHSEADIARQKAERVAGRARVLAARMARGERVDTRGLDRDVFAALLKLRGLTPPG